MYFSDNTEYKEDLDIRNIDFSVYTSSIDLGIVYIKLSNNKLKVYNQFLSTSWDIGLVEKVRGVITSNKGKIRDELSKVIEKSKSQIKQ